MAVCEGRRNSSLARWPPNPSHCWALTWRTISPWRTIKPALEDYWLGGPFYLGRSVIQTGRVPTKAPAPMLALVCERSPWSGLLFSFVSPLWGVAWSFYSRNTDAPHQGRGCAFPSATSSQSGLRKHRLRRLSFDFGQSGGQPTRHTNEPANSFNANDWYINTSNCPIWYSTPFLKKCLKSAKIPLYHVGQYRCEGRPRRARAWPAAREARHAASSRRGHVDPEYVRRAGSIARIHYQYTSSAQQAAALPSRAYFYIEDGGLRQPGRPADWGGGLEVACSRAGDPV